MSEKHQYTFAATLASGQQINITVKAASREEAERLMWRKVTQAGLDMMPNPHEKPDGVCADCWAKGEGWDSPTEDGKCYSCHGAITQKGLPQ